MRVIHKLLRSNIDIIQKAIEKLKQSNMISSSRMLATKTAPIATRAIAASKVAAPRAVTQRQLSSSGVIAIEKLRGVIEDYRREK